MARFPYALMMSMGSHARDVVGGIAVTMVATIWRRRGKGRIYVGGCIMLWHCALWENSGIPVLCMGVHLLALLLLVLEGSHGFWWRANTGLSVRHTGSHYLIGPAIIYMAGSRRCAWPPNSRLSRWKARPR